MELGPIWRANLRNKTGPILIALQIAFTLAVVANGLFIIQQRIEKISRPTGMDVDNIFTVQSYGMGEDFDGQATARADLHAIRAVPGVVAVTSSQHVPLSGSGWGTNRQTSTEHDAPTENAAQYMVTADAIEALGVRLESGRGFTAEDVEYPKAFGDWPDKVIVTRAYADALFPDGGGKPGAVIYDGLGNPQTIIGVIEHMHGAWVGWDKLAHVMLVPTVRVGEANYYVIRTESGQRDRLMPEVEALLVGMNGDRVVKDLRTLEEIRDRSYMGDRGMAVLLATVVVMMIIVTGVGIVGLASFAVRQRTKQIGTRRASGARKRDIVRYFMVENWMVTTIGVSIGAFLTLGINYWLVTSFELERLDPVYVPAGILALWGLGLLAVLGPARRASNISPAVATRTV